MNKQSFIVRPDSFARATWKKAFDFGAELLEYGPVQVTVRSVKETRSQEQNDRMWAMLTDISKQVEWPVDGKQQKLDAEEWKHIFSAGLKQHQRVAAGLEGGFVILGQRTSKMTVRQMTDLIDLVQAFGDQRGVQWSDPKAQSFQQTYMQAAA